ncbi:putative spermidine/putrescine transport system ATP-binding protein/mannopine transport system ATP-binding protein [Rhizobium petrolearium]|uniref:ABC transporter ATP-binding protein n=1 Tax=Neorhizobium petrolearium TaxID=515361 RepID=UPI001F4851E9|nr:ABC transporter ATP-binding protein [Neorhizobium petrolearium]MBP1845656.1 putative spermidine/putrescine transport system ATP-binding protein/mannopine transport system ATP-binding protein [Neorhizobium petrolearium]
MNREQTAGASIRISRLEKRFGNVSAVDGVDIDISAGEFLALLGPSGSGKTTILMSLAGFEFPTAGNIVIGSEDLTYVPANKRNLGMVFQNYTLFPHMSILDNVAFPLKMRGVAKPERYARAEEALATVRLAGYGERFSSQLSGGQQQRVALARAIVYRPRVLLMDEPLSALDKNLREDMQLEIKRLHAELGITVIFVTHDQSEALTMADRVAVLKDGRIQQIGPSRELYERPANLFTAGFIGEMNFIGVTVESVGEAIAVSLPSGEHWNVPSTSAVDPLQAGQKAVLAVRPERLQIGGEGAAFAFHVKLADIVYAGSALLLIGHLPDGTEIRARLPGASDLSTLTPGATAVFSVPKEAILLYAGGAK